MEYFAFFIVLVIVVLLVYFLNGKKATKNTAVKKAEIISMYEKDMKNLLNSYESNTQELKVAKIKLLKKINNELSMNIFFDAQESRDILKKLTNMEK